MVAQALGDYKTSTILVSMILNGKGCLTGSALQGVQYRFHTLPIAVFVCLLLFVYIIVEQWRRSGGLHQVWADWSRVV